MPTKDYDNWQKEFRFKAITLYIYIYNSYVAKYIWLLRNIASEFANIERLKNWNKYFYFNI